MDEERRQNIKEEPQQWLKSIKQLAYACLVASLISIVVSYFGTKYYYKQKIASLLQELTTYESGLKKDKKLTTEENRKVQKIIALVDTINREGRDCRQDIQDAKNTKCINKYLNNFKKEQEYHKGAVFIRSLEDQGKTPFNLLNSKNFFKKLKENYNYSIFFIEWAKIK